jgi:hypothetical protein
MTNESAFPNITHEELHVSMNKYTGAIHQGDMISGNMGSSGGSSGAIMFGNLLDDTNS